MDIDTLDRVLGSAWHDDFSWEFLTRLCEIDSRLGGHPGERRAAAVVDDELDHAGLDPAIESFEMQCWTPGRAELTVRVPSNDDIERDEVTERSFETFALPYSPAGDHRAELVDVGCGTPTELRDVDVTGNIVLASTDSPPGERRVHRMEKVGHAAAAGAGAFVFHNHLPGQLPPTGALRFGAEAAIPGVGVSRETGAWLTEYAERGAETILRVESTTETGTSQNVVGTLGPDTDEEVLLVAHYDAHNVAEGALDNGCGITVAIAAVRILAAIDLDSRVRVAAVGCEELGLLGSETLAESIDNDRVSAVINVDGAGRFRNLRALTHTSEAMTAVATRTSDKTGHSIAVSERPHPYSDHWPFLRRGIPALQLHSQRPESGGRWDRGFTHTRADTRDKVDPRNLRDHAMLTALLVRELTAIDPNPIDTNELRTTLSDAGAEPGMRAAGVWPDEWE